MSKAAWIIGVLGLVSVATGVTLFVGPGTRLHHELHRSGILEPCGCRGSDESGCEWVAKPYVWQSWAGHHRRLQRYGILLVAASLALVGGYWGVERTTRWGAQSIERHRQIWGRACGTAILILVLGIWACFIFL